MPNSIFNIPTNVSVGTTLTATRYNELFASDGSLHYLYEGLSPYFGNCGYDQSSITPPPISFYPGQVYWIKNSVSLASNTLTTIPFDVFQLGAEFFNGTIFSTASTSFIDSGASSVIPMYVGIFIYAGFASNTTGARFIRIDADAPAGGNVERARYSATARAMSVAGSTFVNYFNIVRFNPSQPTHHFTLNVLGWQNSGGVLSVGVQLGLFKMPAV